MLRRYRTFVPVVVLALSASAAAPGAAQTTDGAAARAGRFSYSSAPRELDISPDLEKSRHASQRLRWAISSVTLSAQGKTFEDTVALEPGGSLSLDTLRGSVQLTSWDRSTVEIRVRIEPPPGVDEDYARRAVEGTTIDYDSDGRSVRIRSNYSGVPPARPAVGGAEIAASALRDPRAAATGSGPRYRPE